MYPKYVTELAQLTYDMWRAGWDEYNGGNVSYLLSEKEVEQIVSDFLDTDYPIYNGNNVTKNIMAIPKNLIGKHLLVTATFSHFRNLKERISIDTGIVKLTDDGYQVIAGFSTGKKPTSEIYMHILSHSARLYQDKNHRVVVHNHATNLVLYSLIDGVTSKKITMDLWRVLTESIVVFPDGLAILPWETPGTLEIGKKTAEELRNHRIVVWSKHGVLATGINFQDCYGLIETANKAAGIAIELQKITGKHLDELTLLTPENLIEVCNALGVTAKYIM